MVAQQIDEDVRRIQASAAPTRFARGWHCLGLADSFRDGATHGIDAFGTRLVVFADTNGSVHVLNGFCPHMGGDLSAGAVKGDEVACPFHDWRWAGNGRCTRIPYAKRIPPRARTQAWTSMERNGMLLVWHDPQGNPPPPEVTVPEISGVGVDGWTPWTWNSVLIEGSHSREIVDNVVDMAHFYYVHFAFPLYFKNVFENHIAVQQMKMVGRPDINLGTSYSTGDDAVNRGEATYYGPAVLFARSWRPLDSGGELEVVLATCHYPVTPTSFMLQWGVSIKQPDGRSPEEAQAMARAFIGGVEKGFMQDVEIWRNKARIDNPLLCEEDGPVYQLRRWYEQFYVDVEDVTPDMTDRFEYEIDTTRANDFWRQEVAENLASAAAERVV